MVDVQLHVDDILSALPHTIQALEIDKVDIHSDYCVGIKTYKKNDKALSGHFGIVPGTRLVEAALQTSVFVPMDNAVEQDFIALEILSAKFRCSVKENDTIYYKVKRVGMFGAIHEYECIATNDSGYKVLSCRFRCK